MKLLLLVALVAIAVASLTTIVSAYSAIATTKQKQLGTGATTAPKVIWHALLGGTGYGNDPLLDAAKGWLYVNGGDFIAVVNVTDGSTLQNTSSPGTSGYSDFAKANGTIYHTARDSVLCRDSTIVSREVWRFVAASSFDSTPLYVDEQKAIFAASTDCVLYKLDASSGTQAWNVTLPGVDGSFNSQPAYSAKYNLVIVGAKSGVNAVDATNGHIAWQHVTSGQVQVTGVFSPDGETIIYADNEGAVTAFAVATGKPNWNYEAETSISNTPSLLNGVLYLDTSGGTCVAINATTGKQIWDISCKPVDAGVSRIYGDTVIFPTAHGIIAVAQNGSGVAWQWAGSENAVWGMTEPTADGKIYVTASNGNVFALQLPSSGRRGGISVKECWDSACSSQCSTRNLPVGKCVQTGATSSITRTCSPGGTKLYAKTFSLSSTCDPSSEYRDSEFLVGKCYPLAMAGFSEVTECSS